MTLDVELRTDELFVADQGVECQVVDAASLSLRRGGAEFVVRERLWLWPHLRVYKSNDHVFAIGRFDQLSGVEFTRRNFCVWVVCRCLTPSRCTFRYRRKGIVRGRGLEPGQRPDLATGGCSAPCQVLRPNLTTFFKARCQCGNAPAMADHHQSETGSLPLSQHEPGRPSPKASLSCLPYMDALWSCYSPVYQMKQYYKCGELDGCGGKWVDMFSCISLKTKPSAEVEAVLREREARKQNEHIWSYRTQEDASEFWKEQFGHLQK